jgi:hypothetical protein
MCKLIAYFEGGFTFDTLSIMPLDELSEIIKCANTIEKERKNGQ